MRRHRTTAGHVAGTARIRGLVAGLQYSFDHQTRVFYDSAITRHLRRFTTLRPVLPARFLVLVSRRSETTAARFWYCKNGLGHILHRFNGSTCFAISLYEYENGCCLFAVKIFFVKSVVMPVLSCWVGYTAVMSNLVVSPLGVGLEVLVLQYWSC